MLKLTATCQRCGESRELDVTGTSLSNDDIRKLGFAYVCEKLICNKCRSEFREYQEKLDLQRKRQECEFFSPLGEEKEKKYDKARGRRF